MSAVRFAVATTGDAGLDGVVSPHFGRCSHFTFVEVEGDEVRSSTVMENPFFESHAPGQVPSFLESQGVQVVIAGAMGAGAERMLTRWGIDVATGWVGNVRAAVQAYLRGELRGFDPCGEHGVHECGRSPS